MRNRVRAARHKLQHENPRETLSPEPHFILGALLAALPAAYAADEPAAPPSPEARRERMEKAADRMTDELGLNDDQKAKWKTIGQQERAELKTLHDNAALSQEDRRAQAGEIHKKFKDQRDALLTPDQKAKADKMRERFEKRQEHREKAGDK